MKKIKLKRPYPFDLERKQAVERVMYACGIKTVSALARTVEIQRSYLSEIINGTRRSKKNEQKIAAFFGMDRKELFPTRSIPELLAMRDRENARNRKGAA